MDLVLSHEPSSHLAAPHSFCWEFPGRAGEAKVKGAALSRGAGGEGEISNGSNLGRQQDRFDFRTNPSQISEFNG